jgi:hypothetical protein
VGVGQLPTLEAPDRLLEIIAGVAFGRTPDEAVL